MHTVMAVLFLTARFYSVVDVPTGDRVAATVVAAHILGAAGIDFRWTDCNDHVTAGQRVTSERCLTPLAADEVIVRLVHEPASGPVRKPGADRLGDAYVDTAAASGSLATVYVDRVSIMAHAAGIDPGTLLGRVVAHEIGHLLLGTATHRPSGLMRAEWSTTLLQRQMTNDWRFSKLDAADVREGVLRRVRAVPISNAGAATMTLPCLESVKRPLSATCPSCPVCPTVLPAARAIFELLVEPRF